jgi:hypothetical protein
LILDSSSSDLTYDSNSATEEFTGSEETSLFSLNISCTSFNCSITALNLSATLPIKDTSSSGLFSPVFGFELISVSELYTPYSFSSEFSLTATVAPSFWVMISRSLPSFSSEIPFVFFSSDT